MKRKILILAPILALALSGCFARIPTPTSGGGKSSGTTTTTGTSGGTGTVTTDTSVTPVETYGSLDNPITVANARQIGLAIEGAASDNTVYETKDAYIKGIVLNAPEESSKTAGTYRFNIGDAYGAADYVQFYWGKVDTDVTLPVEGDEVVLFGRLANYHNGYIIELVERTSIGAQTPLVKKSSHRTVNITVTPSEHGEVTGAPETAKTGDVVHLTATPDSNYSTEYVKANGVTLAEDSGQYSFTVKTDTTITASFVEGPVVKSDLQIAYEAAVAAGSTATTSEYTFSGVIVAVTGNSYYVQEDGYAMEVYNHAIDGAAVGKTVSVTATVKTYNGVPETDAVSAASVTGDGQLPAAVEIDSLATLANYNINVLANVQEAEFVSKTGEWTTTSNSVRGVFKVGTDNVTVNFDKNGYNAEAAALFNAATAGAKFRLLNVVTNVYKSATPNQLAFAGSSTLEDATPVVNPTDITMNVASEVTVGAQIPLACTVNPSGASQDVTWSIVSGDQFAEIVDGNKLKGNAAGEVVVKATSNVLATVSNTATVQVKAAQKTLIENIEADPTSLEMRVGDDPATITLTVTPSTGYEEEIEWDISSASGIATINVANDKLSATVTPTDVGTATISIKGAESGNGIENYSITIEPKISTIQEVYTEALKLDNNTPSTEEYTFSGVVVATMGNSYFLQQDGYGLEVYNFKTDGVALGKVVTVTSTIKHYKGLPETASVSGAIVGEAGTLPAAAEIASANDLGNLKTNVLANLKNAEFISLSDTWSSSKTVYAMFKVGNDSLRVNFDKSAYNESPTAAGIIAAAQAEEKYDLTNIVTNAYYNSNPQPAANQLLFTATSTISKIEAEPTDIVITSANKVIKGQTLNLAATVNPTGSSQEVTWDFAEATTLATIDGNVLTAGNTEGTVKVRATSTAKADVTAEQTITITKNLAQSLVFTNAPFTLENDAEHNMKNKLTITPNDAEVELFWELVDPTNMEDDYTGAAIIDVETGVLSIPQTVTDPIGVKVTDLNSEKVATALVNVTDTVVHVTGVAIDPASLEMEVGDQDVQLVANLTPTDPEPTDKSVTWSITGTEGVVTVSSTGLVHAIAAGTTEVTVTTTDGGYTATCAVTVTAPVVNTVQVAYEAVVDGDTSSKTFTGVVVSKNNNAHVVQDGDYGINVYAAAPDGTEVGDIVTVTATLKLYNGCPQTDAISAEEKTGTGTLPTAEAVSSKVTLDALNHNVLANVAEATFVSKNKAWASNATAQFVFTIGEDDITVSFDKQGYDANKANLLNAAVEGDKFKLDNLITSAYNGVNQLNFTGTSSVTEIETPIPDPTSINITSSNTVAVNQTLTLTATVLPAKASQEVTWSIKSGGDKATLNGNVLTAGSSTGTVTVTATSNAKQTVTADMEITITSSVQTISYNKITSVDDLTDGEYLLVAYYSAGSTYYVYNGSQNKDNQQTNTVTVTNNSIAGSETVNAYTFTITSMTGGYSIKNGLNKYLSGTTGSNTTNYGDAAVANTFTAQSDGTFEISCNDTYLQFNPNVQKQVVSPLFRFYKASNRNNYIKIQLYKKVVS